MIDIEAYHRIAGESGQTNTTLVAVSKTKPAEDILALYDLGQRDFGENYVQELVDKRALLPPDIRWHFIGHLQTNKVKYIAPFVFLIHGVDSLKLLQEINKQGARANRVVDCLLQVHIAVEETKFGFDEQELEALFASDLSALKNIRVKGLMGMASFSDDVPKVENEFGKVKSLFDKYASISTSNCQLSIISMGMSGDYPLAIKQGSTMVRIGSLLFGKR